MGGIASGRDARDFVSAGASAIALGTALFSDPSAPDRVRAELGVGMTEPTQSMRGHVPEGVS
jgi:dihydroorotate dehydrogenase (NAD+) catalytic subunit